MTRTCKPLAADLYLHVPYLRLASLNHAWAPTSTAYEFGKRRFGDTNVRATTANRSAHPFAIAIAEWDTFSGIAAES